MNPNCWKEKFKVGDVFILEGEPFIIAAITRRGLALRHHNEKQQQPIIVPITCDATPLARTN